MELLDQSLPFGSFQYSAWIDLEQVAADEDGVIPGDEDDERMDRVYCIRQGITTESELTLSFQTWS